MLTDNRTPAHNSRFASGGLTCKREGLCSYSALVLVDSLVLLCPPERKAAKRYRSVYKDSQQHIQAHLVLPTHKTETKTKRA